MTSQAPAVRRGRHFRAAEKMEREGWASLAAIRRRRNFHVVFARCDKHGLSGRQEAFDSFEVALERVHGGTRDYR